MRKVIVLCAIYSLMLLSACSQSGRRQPNTANEPANTNFSNTTAKDLEEKTIIKMERKDGINQIPVEINGVKMFFIFDTGSEMVSISATEANFLYKQGTLTDEDILGKADFTTANGTISEGTIINLKTVQVGDMMLTNIKASVVDNIKAPLLLGQSVLGKFGKISIDNNKGEITFE